jgi:hypothetical protein
MAWLTEWIRSGRGWTPNCYLHCVLDLHLSAKCLCTGILFSCVFYLIYSKVTFFTYSLAFCYKPNEYSERRRLKYSCEIGREEKGEKDFNRILPSSGLLRSERWFETDVPSSRVKMSWTSWPLKIRTIGSPETSVSNHLTPRNNSEDGIIESKRGESLQFCREWFCWRTMTVGMIIRALVVEESNMSTEHWER